MKGWEVEISQGVKISGKSRLNTIMFAVNQVFSADSEGDFFLITEHIGLLQKHIPVFVKNIQYLDNLNY